MRGTPEETPESILLGRRALQELSSATIVEDLRWNADVARWVLTLDLRLSVHATSDVPSSTRWHVLIEDRYPRGTMDLFPSKNGGITATFPHQTRNDEGDHRVSWRTGKICVEETGRWLGRTAWDREPRTAKDRLLWHVRRACSWLDAAATNQLTPAGTPYELPDFRSASVPIVAFVETAESYAGWCSSKVTSGLATVHRLRTNEGDVRLVLDFGNGVGAPLALTPNLSPRKTAAIWFRLPRVPILPPWRAPRTWKELRAAIATLGLDLDVVLKRLLRHVRDEDPPLLLLGFPIPATFGKEAVHLHWKAIRLPKLGAVAKGFRDERGYWQKERQDLLADDRDVKWLETENWSRDEIGRRSRLATLSSFRPLLIGAGAIGSIVGELLVRGGCSDMTIMDADDLEVGNLVRHTLAMRDVKRPKATALAERLMTLGPTIRATPYPISFPPTGQHRLQSIGDRNLIIDCTGADDVLDSMSEVEWSEDCLLISLSAGLGAKRLYCYLSRGHLDADAFRKLLEPYVTEDARTFDGELPWDAAGCWHPLFPARLDELWSTVATAIGKLEALLWDNSQLSSVFFVVERTADGGLAIK